MPLNGKRSLCGGRDFPLRCTHKVKTTLQSPCHLIECKLCNGSSTRLVAKPPDEHLIKRLLSGKKGEASTISCRP
jgi:hypothetical protein